MVRREARSRFFSVSLRMTSLAALSLVAIFFVVGAEDGATVGEYAGDDSCTACHSDVADAFGATVHGRAEMSGWQGSDRCESCHGPGQAHIDAGGDASLIVNPATADAMASQAACSSCHSGNTGAFWHGSAHDRNDVSCSSCHNAHEPWQEAREVNNKALNENCLTCHRDMRKHLYQRSGHPLREGQMTCVSCHDPHGTPTEGSISALTKNDKCYECHADKRGPYLYEHTPVREDCMTCHDAHGSNQTQMLVASAPRLCQSCHLFGHHQTVPGMSRQVWNQNRSCLNCHPRIHGSNHPSGVIFMR